MDDSTWLTHSNSKTIPELEQNLMSMIKLRNNGRYFIQLFLGNFIDQKTLHYYESSSDKLAQHGNGCEVISDQLFVGEACYAPGDNFNISVETLDEAREDGSLETGTEYHPGVLVPLSNGKYHLKGLHLRSYDIEQNAENWTKAEIKHYATLPDIILSLYPVNN
jgi:hypothetical protein